MSKRFKVGMQVMVAGDHTGVGPINKSVKDMGFENGETVELIEYDSKDETWRVRHLKHNGVTMWIKRKNLATVEVPQPNPFKVGDKVELINKDAEWASDDDVTTGVEYTVKKANIPEDEDSAPYIIVSGAGAKGVYWIECKYFRLSVPKPAEPERAWKIGDQFKVLSATVYTIEVSDMKDRVKITWVDDRGDNDSMLYDVADLDEYFSKGSWKLVEKTNIQENVSPVQTPDVPLQPSKTQTTMAKKIVYCINPSGLGTPPPLTKNKGYEVLKELSAGPGIGSHRYVLINDRGNKEEYYQHRFTSENPNKEMAKQTALPVSPAFIIEAHKVACSDWKAKLEKMYPSVFLPAQTFKVGDRIQFPQSTQFTNATYLLANTGNRRMGLINMQTGGRWTELVEVKSESAITAEEMQKICYNQKLDTILVNGTTPTLNTKPSKEKTLTAKISDILAAYEATSDATTKRMIKGYFPEAFSQYVKFIESSAGNVTLSSHTSHIDGADFIIGRGLAPRPELEGACIGVDTDKVEVEVITSGAKTWVAFKKK